MLTNNCTSEIQTFALDILRCSLGIRGWCSGGAEQFVNFFIYVTFCYVTNKQISKPQIPNSLRVTSTPQGRIVLDWISLLKPKDQLREHKSPPMTQINKIQYNPSLRKTW